MPNQNSIQQLNAIYDGAQDRIRFSFCTQDGSEMRFWVTRRYLGQLLKALAAVATDYASLQAPDNVVARQAIAEMAQMQTLNQADRESPFKGGNQFPLGQEPILLAKIIVKNLPDGQRTLSLLPENGTGIDISLNQSLTYLMADLLSRTAHAAEWQVSVPTLVAPSVSMGEGVGRLH